MKKKADVKRILLIGIPLLLLAVGIKMLDDEARLLWFERNGTDFTQARFYLFSGEKERAFDVGEGDSVRITWDTDLNNGSLMLEVSSPGNKDTRKYREPRVIDFVSASDGRVKTKIIGHRARGNFKLIWDVRSTP